MRAVVSVAVVASAAGCGSGGSESEPISTETPTTTTRTPRVVDDSGRPQITFDPCLDIPDELLLEAGYDPRSEEIADYPMGDYTFLSCSYKGTLHVPGVLFRYDLSVLAGNVTLEEELAKDRHISIKSSINGKQALLELDPNNKNTCAITLRAEFGIVIVTRTYYADHNRDVPQSEWCSGLEVVASSIEPLINN